MIRRLVDFKSTILPRQLIHDDKISRPMTHLLAKFKYLSLFDV